MSYSDDINKREDTDIMRVGLLSADTTVLGSNSQTLVDEIWYGIEDYTHKAASNSTAHYAKISSDEFSVQHNAYIGNKDLEACRIYWRDDFIDDGLKLNNVIRLYNTTEINKQVSTTVPYYYWEGKELIEASWNVDAMINELIASNDFNNVAVSSVTTIQPATNDIEVSDTSTSAPVNNNDKDALLITETEWCDYLTRLEYKKLPPNLQKELGNHLESIKWSTKSVQKGNDYLYSFRYNKQVNAWNSDTNEVQIDITTPDIIKAQEGIYPYEADFSVLDDENIYFIDDNVIIPYTNVKLSRFIKECIINGDGSLYSEITPWSSDVVKSTQMQVGYLLRSYKNETYKVKSPEYGKVYNYYFYYNDPTSSQKKMLILTDQVISSIEIGHYPIIGYGDNTIYRVDNGESALYIIQDTTYCDYLSRLIGQNLPPNLQSTLGNYFNSIKDNTFKVFAEGHSSDSIIVGYWFKWMEPQNQWTSGGKKEFITTSAQIQRLLDQNYPYTVISVDDSAVYEISDSYYLGLLNKTSPITDAEIRDLAQYLQYNKNKTKTIFNSAAENTIYWFKYRNNSGTLIPFSISQGSIDTFLTFGV